MTKNIVYGAVIAGAALGAIAFFGFSPFGKSVIQNLVGSSPAGTTFTNAKYAGIAVNLATIGANGTSSSILNGDANDRFITSIDYGCESLAGASASVASLSFKVATTSTASPALFTNTNIINMTSFFIGTGTPQYVAASTTASINTTSSASSTLIWPSGTYLTFYTNATDTAVCTLGAKYIGS